ncbi:unnamed protein product [Amoebophrya sp. A25]|nr:unnamed protein product [Amoebophrya sp. A25]|eukprot:GSA25T00010047001.1
MKSSVVDENISEDHGLLIKALLAANTKMDFLCRPPPRVRIKPVRSHSLPHPPVVVSFLDIDAARHRHHRQYRHHDRSFFPTFFDEVEGGDRDDAGEGGKDDAGGHDLLAEAIAAYGNEEDENKDDFQRPGQLPPRPISYASALSRVTHHLPTTCQQRGKANNVCDVMGQTIEKHYKRPAEDFYFLGARPGEYGRPPMIAPAVAGSPSAAVVPLPGAFDPSMQLQSAGAFAAESKRAALYANEMLNLGKHMYKIYLTKLGQNFRHWKPRISATIGADSFPLY